MPDNPVYVANKIAILLKEASHLLHDRKQRHVVYWNGEVHSIAQLSMQSGYDERQDDAKLMDVHTANFRVIYTPYNNADECLSAFLKWMMEQWVK